MLAAVKGLNTKEPLEHKDFSKDCLAEKYPSHKRMKCLPIFFFEVTLFKCVSNLNEAAFSILNAIGVIDLLPSTVCLL